MASLKHNICRSKKADYLKVQEKPYFETRSNIYLNPSSNQLSQQLNLALYTFFVNAQSSRVSG
jgi:hypothetical protein